MESRFDERFNPSFATQSPRQRTFMGGVEIVAKCQKQTLRARFKMKEAVN
jgi:hypothetical protein